MAYLQRLKSLEKSQHGDFADVLELIRKGLHYNELTERQRERYKLYRESLGGVADDIAAAELDIMFNDTPEQQAYDFKLSHRKRPLTEKEFKQRVQEVEELVQGFTDEYNSPGARAERQRQYEELQHIGEQRAAAFNRGEPMSNYPLPWEVKA